MSHGDLGNFLCGKVYITYWDRLFSKSGISHVSEYAVQKRMSPTDLLCHVCCKIIKKSDLGQKSTLATVPCRQQYASPSPWRGPLSFSQSLKPPSTGTELTTNGPAGTGKNAFNAILMTPTCGCSLVMLEAFCGSIRAKELFIESDLAGIISRMCRPWTRNVVCICPHIPERLFT